MAAMSVGSKLTTMNVEDIKRDEEFYKTLSSIETKIMEWTEVIRALSDSILDLTRRLEVVEGNDARPKTCEESREAYMQILEEKDPNRWIEILAKDEGQPLPPTCSPSS